MEVRTSQNCDGAAVGTVAWSAGFTESGIDWLRNGANAAGKRRTPLSSRLRKWPSTLTDVSVS